MFNCDYTCNPPAVLVGFEKQVLGFAENSSSQNICIIIEDVLRREIQIEVVQVGGTAGKTLCYFHCETFT